MRILIPLLFWLWLAGLCLSLSPSFDEFARTRWDGVHYVSIATRGFELVPCGPALEARGIKICGNPWFPGWSYWNVMTSMPFAFAFGVSVEKVFIANAAVLFFILLYLAYNRSDRLLSGSQPSASSRVGLWSCIGLVAQPGSFYYLTQFPYTFTLLTGFGFLLLYRRSKFGMIASSTVLGVGSTLAYPSAFLFGAFPAFDFFSKIRFSSGIRKVGKKNGLKVIGWGVVFLSGTLIYAVINWIKFDEPMLYFKHQAQFGRTGHNPIAVIFDLLWSGHQNERLSFLWYGVGWGLIVARLKGAFREPAVYFILAVLLFSPLTGSWICLYRHYLLCLPLGALMGAARLPIPIKLGYFAVGAWMGFALFLPRYLSGALM